MDAASTPDWGTMIDDLQAAGMTWPEIAAALGYSMLSESMLRALRGGTQPTYWRGALMLEVWCKRTGKSRPPMVGIDIQPRQRETRRPTVVSLPQWPAAKKRGRPPKVLQAA